MIAKAMHEKARKKVQKIEEIRMEVKVTHIYYGARTKVICKKCKKAWDLKTDIWRCERNIM